MRQVGRARPVPRRRKSAWRQGAREAGQRLGEFTGRLQAVETVESAAGSGYIDKVGFTEGSQVKRAICFFVHLRGPTRRNTIAAAATSALQDRADLARIEVGSSCSA